MEDGLAEMEQAQQLAKAIADTKKEEEAKDKLDDEKEKPLVDPRMRYLYYVGLQSAMNFRESYWEKEVIENNRSCAKMFPKLNPGKSITTKNLNKWRNEIAWSFEKKGQSVNKRTYDEVASAIGMASTDMQDQFMLLAKNLSDASKELFYSRRREDMITLMRIFNTGALDNVFDDLKKEADEKEKLEEVNQHQKEETLQVDNGSVGEPEGGITGTDGPENSEGVEEVPTGSELDSVDSPEENKE